MNKQEFIQKVKQLRVTNADLGGDIIDFDLFVNDLIVLFCEMHKKLIGENEELIVSDMNDFATAYDNGHKRDRNEIRNTMRAKIEEMEGEKEV